MKHVTLLSLFLTVIASAAEPILSIKLGAPTTTRSRQDIIITNLTDKTISYSADLSSKHPRYRFQYSKDGKPAIMNIFRCANGRGYVDLKPRASVRFPYFPPEIPGPYKIHLDVHPYAADAIPKGSKPMPIEAPIAPPTADEQNP
ncbi:hypothetical protein SAMN02745181_3430 [Rubritalea squalenifaciens DSM 18772]|uniref:Uncharacterized protein n=1 Tax=Rubritalea squalenifaciens DSM 18772 TaxID=1123071 RepID=A0A1M6QKZ5_9BACT|nr:hypothetical protein [Rubritalea squalenifaciens]SHK20848.1 hypothetical protein SAMN02745181_3430 [Rubritalea squalenifaciens DSM 18772]